MNIVWIQNRLFNTLSKAFSQQSPRLTRLQWQDAPGVFACGLHQNGYQKNIKNPRSEHASSPLIDLRGEWPQEELDAFIKDMRVVQNFITNEEEGKLLNELEPHLKRLRYEYDHWDDAIHGFRETERMHWYPDNRKVLDRVRQVGFNGEIMAYVHVLDLAEQGVIKPHVDSTRYCGSTIAGVSLLSDCVMRLVRTKEAKYKQHSEKMQLADPPQIDEAYRNQTKTTIENNFYADILLDRRSLYIMSHTSRYNFTHEILSNDCSEFRGIPVHKKRRISIICRNDP